MRNQRRKVWSGEIPPNDKYIEFRLPDSAIARKGLEFVPEQNYDRITATIQTARQNEVCLCVEKIGDESVGFDDLRHGGLDDYFSPREVNVLTGLREQLTRPNEGEERLFLDSCYQFREDEKQVWEGEILTGSEFEEHEEAKVTVKKLQRKIRKEDSEERIETLEDRLEAAQKKKERLEGAALTVRGVVPNTRFQRKCTEQTDVREDHPVLLRKEIQENQIRSGLVEINGEPVNYKKLEGTKLDEALSPKEQHLVIKKFEEFLEGGEEEEDFLREVGI